MEDNFDQNDFEEFLKDQVRNHRMYPSDAVWRDINKKLHGDKKWPPLTIAAFTLLSATIAISVYFTPKPDIVTINPSDNELKNSTLSNSQHTADLTNLSSSASLSNGNITLAEASKNTSPAIAAAMPAIHSNQAIGLNKQITEGSEDKKVNASPADKEAVEKQVDQNPTPASAALTSQEETSKEFENLPVTIRPKEVTTSRMIKPLAEKLVVSKDYNDKNMVDKFLKDHKEDISLHTASKIKSIKNKFSFQIYIAPSVSYRKLLEDRSILKEGAISGPVGLNYVADVNKVVRHRPGNGLEAGVSIMYHLSHNFRIKSGLQFNVRQYNIEAYRSSTELASIALIENNRIDTINTLAIYRNSNGYYPAELVNRYYQIAIPLGIEWEIIGNKRIQLNIAGSIQPTYLINHNAYLLSTNFKNYTENPEMVRSFNLNSNVETYISFKAGDFKWQIGPQLRYQPYSTFIPQYPIKEHLLDYGIKLGISKTF
jgi:hypothetical protein